MKFYTGSRSPGAAALLLAAVCAGPTAMAADKALLMGVGQYATGINNLPGIALDLKVMQQVARKMGYLKENILVLQDAAVTADSVRAAMRGWLVEGVAADDRVLVYYSGHGSQVTDLNGDERDGFDEVLTMYDLAYADGEYTGVLRDDEFNALLEGIPSERVAVVVDACCSGTAMRSLNIDSSAYGAGEFVVKSQGCRSTQTDSSAGFADSESVQGMVFLAAAQDGEQSLATTRGSLFTLALQRAVLEGKNASPLQLIAAAENTLVSSVPKEHRFHPSLIGDPELLIDKGLFVVDTVETQDAERLVWEQWFDLVKAGEPLQVQPSREAFVDGQMLELDVDMPRAGYLNIVAVNSDDQVVVLFPNDFHRDNFFQKGVVKLPEQGFDWPAGRPYGESLIVSVVTEQPVNLYASSHQRNAKGEAQGVFLRPEMADSEQLIALASQAVPAVHVSALMLTVCGAGGC